MIYCHCERDRCPCYGEGYAAGKDKAHFEVRRLDSHAARCGCEPCITVREVAAKLAGVSKPPLEPPEFPVYLDAQGNEHA